MRCSILLIEEKLNVEILIFMMSAENMRRILQKPYVMVGSDAGALTHEPPLGAGRPHPRNFGTFPFVLGALARDESLFPLAEAIRKMTSAPCWRMGIEDRGRLAVGMKADLVLFDPDEIRDECTYERPIGVSFGRRDGPRERRGRRGRGNPYRSASRPSAAQTFPTGDGECLRWLPGRRCSARWGCSPFWVSPSFYGCAAAP